MSEMSSKMTYDVMIMFLRLVALCYVSRYSTRLLLLI